MTNSNQTKAVFLACGWDAAEDTMKEAICAFFHETDQLGRLAEWLRAQAGRRYVEPFDMTEMQDMCRQTAKIIVSSPQLGDSDSGYVETVKQFLSSDDDKTIWNDRTCLREMQTLFILLRDNTEFRDLFCNPEKPGFKASAMLCEYLYRTL